MEVEELTADEAYSIAVGEAKHKLTTEIIRMAIDDGLLAGVKKTLNVPPVSQSWLDTHAEHVTIDPHERERHRRLKLRVARHLYEEEGVDLATVSNPDAGTDPSYLFSCFEIECPYGHADIGAPTDGVYVEVGKTNPERVTSAFGLVATIFRGIWRDRPTNTERMITVPYPTRETEELRLFEFQKGPELEGARS